MNYQKIKSYFYLMRFHKPIGIFLLLWPTLWALWISSHGFPSIKNLIIFVMGVIVMRAAGCVINDFADREFDRHVARTKLRPITTGEISARSSLILFSVLCVIAFILVLFTNKLTILLSFLASTINDAPIMYHDSGENKWWRPQNDTLEFYGPTRLRVGLTESRNLVSIRLLRAIGVPYTVDYLQRFGFDPNKLPHELSLALGSGVVTPLQIASGYAVFANGGYRITPFFIDKVVNEDNQVIFQAQSVDSETLRSISPQNAYLMTQALKSVIQNGTGKAAMVLKRKDLAGKTGTTNEQMDAWFSGFNGNLLATVWVGFDNHDESLQEYGSQVALPIWIQFMKIALANQPEATMPQPLGIVTARIDPETGYLASPRQKNAIFEVFEKNEVPKHFAHTRGGNTTLSASNANSNTGVGGNAADQIF